MATYIKTLKEDNGDITYPQTKASAVLLTNNSDLETEMAKYVTAEDIASTSALTPPVQTNMIADSAVTTAKIANSAVTSDKIDWTTLAPSSWFTLNSTYGCYYAKYGNIVFLRILFRGVTATTASLGTLPTGYRPAYDVGVRNAYDNQQGLIYIAPTGSVTLQWTGTTPTYFFATAVFPT